MRHNNYANLLQNLKRYDEAEEHYGPGIFFLFSLGGLSAPNPPNRQNRAILPILGGAGISLGGAGPPQPPPQGG